MEFTEMRDMLIAHAAEMMDDATKLFEVDLDKDYLWYLYLNSFPAGTNEIYRERREYDCSCCRHFIKTVGNMVTIKDNKVTTIWGFNTNDTTFQPVLTALDNYVKSRTVSNVYVTNEKRIGTPTNREVTPDGSINTYDHFYMDIPEKFVNKTRRSEGDIKGDFRDVRNVFKRSLDEITVDAIETVLELIAQNSLYRGKEWEKILGEFLKYKKEYERTPEDERDNYAWEKSIVAGPVIGKIRNHSMGTLLTNISEGMDLDTAVRKYEQIVAPQNYKRSSGVFTKKMLEDAKKTIAEMGYMDSLKRRFARVDDITVNNILFCNKDAAKQMGALDVFAEMEKDVVASPKKFSGVEEIGIEKFISDVLPTAREVELYLENKHAGNMVSLIAPEIKDSKTMFKWDNNFSWAYSGNVTDSMKERVKSAGGKVDGDLRFSIQWNECGSDNCDLDAHCLEASGEEIYFRHKHSRTQGMLDVDIIHPNGNIAVENITWADRRTMNPGTYKFFVHQYGGSVKNGFRAEIEFDGQVYSFDYSKSIRARATVEVAEVTLDDNGNFSIKEKFPSGVSSREIWNLHTNQFVPVSVICYSPNYWNEQHGIGNQHVFFMLKDCINPEQPNAMYNEFLNEYLYSNHRKVFEDLGSKLAVIDSDDQLSGVGFSMTKRAEVIVKVKGATERVLKIKF